jgi:hypothetical protein
VNIGAIGQIGSGSVQNALLNEGNRNGYSDFTQAPWVVSPFSWCKRSSSRTPRTTGSIASPLLPGQHPDPDTGQFYVQGQPAMSVPVLATATTDAQGNFVFNVPHVQQLDFGWKQGTVSTSG